MDVSIIIPTKNGGTLLRKVLQSIFSQKTEYSYEVICVDSGSKDDTLSIIREFPCQLYQIPPEEFGHGKTRNFGASKGSGEYIVFLTQDALPVTENWLQSFIEAMKMDPDVVGGFGRHLPYPDCNIFDARDLKQHFKNFGESNQVYWLENRERYEKEEGYRHFLAFFSDNNSCLKRQVWETYPYEDVDFAEDQIWMRKMIELGYKKVYAHDATVYHSHNFPIKTYYQRYFDEYRGLARLHGFQISTSWFKLPFQVLKHIMADVAYIRTRPLSKKEKIKWLIYSVRRNYARYYAGYKGGKYDSYSTEKQERLERKISQQYQQRKA